MALATYRVTGMTCEHCVHAVSEQLKNLGEVTDVTVTLVPGGESGVTYLEVASGVTALILSTFAVLGGYAAAADQAPRTAWISVSVG